ncbi:MAG: hypothetical protein JWO83_3829 [Caulobacteraceae bacterium]|jgi:hypothetical protein|nr:hypothetical protein [Caulobacteraceae bacterium]
MTRLAELSSLIRSKNAGPFVLTFDIMFPDEESYGRVKRSGLLNAAHFAELFRLPPEQVRFFVCDNARAFKFSIPRPLTQGDLADGDLHGGQQFIPLMDIDIP